jgi:anti-sigma-K factor RskA
MNAPADDIHDAAAAYALDALDDLERARFEAHLARCESCRRDVADFRRTASVLGRAAAEAPPPDLRGRVLASIGSVRQESPHAASPARLRGKRHWSTVAAVAAIVLIALLGFVAIDARRDDDRESELIARTLTAPDSTTVELAGSGGRGRVVWSETEGRAVLVLDDLAGLPDERAYELWFVVDDTPRPAGVFRPDGGRVVAVLDDLPTDAQAIAVTEEDAAGADAPTGPLLLQGEV